MNREVHVGFCESVGVKFPRGTRPLIHTRLEFALAQDMKSFQGRREITLRRIFSVSYEEFAG